MESLCQGQTGRHVKVAEAIDPRIIVMAGRTIGRLGLVRMENLSPVAIDRPIEATGRLGMVIDRLSVMIDHARRVVRLVPMAAEDVLRARVAIRAKTARVVAVVVPVAEAIDRNFAVATNPHSAVAEVAEALAAVVPVAVAVLPVLLAEPASPATKNSKPRISTAGGKNWRHPARKISAKTALLMIAKKKCCRAKILLKFRQSRKNRAQSKCLLC